MDLFSGMQIRHLTEADLEPSVANVLQECIEEMKKSWKSTGYPVVTLGTTSLPDRVPPSILSSFKHHISFEAGRVVYRSSIVILELKRYKLSRRSQEKVKDARSS